MLKIFNDNYRDLLNIINLCYVQPTIVYYAKKIIPSSANDEIAKNNQHRNPKPSKTKLNNKMYHSNYGQVQLPRYWEDTEFGKQFRQNTNSIRGIPFILMSYNILSQSALKFQPELYRKNNPLHLHWYERFERIVSEILKIQPHILCLQELEPDGYRDLKTRLASLNFKSTYFKRAGDKKDGCAIFYNSVLFEIIQEQKVNLCKENVALLNRENVAILLKLSLKSNPNSQFIVTTTHLLYNPRREDVRLAQIQLILAELEKLAKRKNSSHCPIIMCGDFNFPNKTAVFELIVKGKIYWTTETIEESTGITNNCRFGDASQNEIVPKQEQVAKTFDKNDPTAKFRKTNNGELNPRTAGVVLSHDFNFGSVLDTQHLDQRATTLHDRWITVDHIFYTKFFDYKTKRLVDRDLLLLSRYLPPLINECCRIGPIPNAVLGSDHYSIAANFLIK